MAISVPWWVMDGDQFGSWLSPHSLADRAGDPHGPGLGELCLLAGAPICAAIAPPHLAVCIV